MNPREEHLISAYLDGSISQEEARTLNALLREDPALRAALLHQSSIHASLQHLETPETQTSGKTLIPFTPETIAAKRPRFPRWPAIAAAVAVVAGLAAIASKRQPSTFSNIDGNLPGNDSHSRPTAVEAYNSTLANLPEAGSLNRPAARTETVKLDTSEKLSYNQHIRPILSENCFHCHGPDAAKREGDIALHERELATAMVKGIAPIVPGDSSSSEAVHRIFDEDDPMPPTDSNRYLTEEQKQMIKRWVDEGAEYQEHWSFVPPVKAEPPTLKNPAAIAHNPIDRFIQHRLETENLSPSPEAPPEVIARRASLALTGLQPSPAALKSFIEDSAPGAHERYVDRLLASDAYAERMGLFWLDAARYADTDGYQNDNGRTNWPWRDWVIAAFRDNMPFDRFTIEQLAGDMLPGATESQKLATAFNRNHRQNGEGGALAEEYFVENVIDRVETTSTVWLGLTTGCARCHDHKYDPISQREFYQFFAYFNSIGEQGIGAGVSAKPILEAVSPLRSIPAALQAEISNATTKVQHLEKSTPQRLAAWIKEQSSATSRDPEEWIAVEEFTSAEVANGEGRLIADTDHTLLFEGQNVQQVDYTIRIPTHGKPVAALRIDALPDPTFGAPRKLARSVNGNFVLTDLRVEAGKDTPRPLAVRQISATYQQANFTIDKAIDRDPKSGWAVFGDKVSAETVSAYVTLESPTTADDSLLILHLDHRSTYADHNIGRLRLHVSRNAPLDTDSNPPPAAVLAAIRKPETSRNAEENRAILDYFTTLDRELITAREHLAALEAKAANAGGGRVPVMVMSETPQPTPTYLLGRGQYNEPDKSETLSRGVLKVLKPNGKMPADRLELARWLVSRENPLTARVVVNRMWQHLFGVGLVKTADDFGSQGELPVNPELLDWLAVEFMDSGWDVKALYRLIATSHTFRQSSRSNIALNERDPENRLLARGPRFRMDGFAIRDLALHASGLLNPELGGPPVKPYQPDGLWTAVSHDPNTRYDTSKGPDLYRKSLYTYWKRAVNPPRETIFDASGREVCNVRNKITNTPLQALALMNDETFIEAARHLAQRMIREGGTTPETRLAHGYHLTTGYRADTEQLAVFIRNRDHFAAHFAAHPQEANDFISIGASPRDATIDPIELASYAAAAHLMLNLDETITLE
jgi:hypothetical protein